jgi:hypothetical protein
LHALVFPWADSGDRLTLRGSDADHRVANATRRV